MYMKQFVIGLLVFAPTFLFGQLEKKLDQTAELIDSRQYGEAESRLKKLLPKHPESGRLFYQLAVCNYYSGKPKKALEYITEAVKLNQTNGRFQAIRGAIWLELEEDDRALNAFDKALLLDSLQAEALLFRSDYFLNQGAHEKSLNDLKKLMTVVKNDDGLFYRMGYNYQALGEYVKASFRYNQCLELNPLDERSLWNLSLCYLARNENDSALSCTSRLIELNPRDDSYHEQRGVCLEAKGRFMEALASYEQAFQTDKKSDYLVAQSRIYERLGEFDEALLMMDGLLSRSFENPAYHMIKSRILAKQGNYKKARLSLALAAERTRGYELPPHFRSLGLWYEYLETGGLKWRPETCDTLRIPDFCLFFLFDERQLADCDIASLKGHLKGDVTSAGTDGGLCQALFFSAIRYIKKGRDDRAAERLDDCIRTGYFGNEYYHLAEVLISAYSN